MKRLLFLLPALAGCAPFGHGAPAPVCIIDHQINHTDVPDDSTILFTMNDRSVYRGRLDRPCIGLSNDQRGFSYEPTDPGTDTLCAHLLIIRLNTSGLVCTLGPLEKLPGKGRL